MGYCIFMLQSNFFIPPESHMAVLEAIRQLDPLKSSPGSRNTHFAFVDSSLCKDARTLGEVLKAWRWRPEFDKEDGKENHEEGNIIDVEFWGEKLWRRCHFV